MNKNARTLVSIVSEQPIPNILFIKSIQNTHNVGRYIFITTEQMEQKNEKGRIMQMCRIEEKDTTAIKVPYDEFTEIKSIVTEKIRNLAKTQQQSHFLVNLTGGTKMMSLAVYDVFKELSSKNTLRAEYFYIPINKNYIENVETTEKTPIKYSLRVKEYLFAYGYIAESVKNMHTAYSESQTIKLWQRYLRLLEEKNTRLRINGELSKGFWFEQYIYYLLRKTLDKADTKYDIQLNLKVYGHETVSQSTENEIDIALVANNRLILFETKKTRWNSLEDLYKFAAKIKNMGIASRGVLVTTGKNAVVPVPDGYATRMELLDRAKLLGISIITLSELTRRDKFERKMLQITLT